MATQTFLALISNKMREVVATVVSLGSSSAGAIPALDATGRLDESVMPVGIGADTKVIVASEALAAGDFVNIYSNAGTANVRKASAVDDTKPANGFVLDNVDSGGSATVYFEGANTALSGLTPGTVYVLSAATPGALVALSSGPSATGNVLQTLGTSTSDTEVNVELGSPITRAAA